VAWSVCVYAVPTPAPARLVVVITKGGTDGVTVTLNACAAVCVPLVTCTVKLPVPAVVGEPLSTPAVESESPAGSDPLNTLHV
jgi:hypothetical protein